MRWQQVTMLYSCYELVEHAHALWVKLASFVHPHTLALALLRHVKRDSRTRSRAKFTAKVLWLEASSKWMCRTWSQRSRPAHQTVWSWDQVVRRPVLLPQRGQHLWTLPATQRLEYLDLNQVCDNIVIVYTKQLTIADVANTAWREIVKRNEQTGGSATSYVYVRDLKPQDLHWDVSEECPRFCPRVYG